MPASVTAVLAWRLRVPPVQVPSGRGAVPGNAGPDFACDRRAGSDHYIGGQRGTGDRRLTRLLLPRMGLIVPVSPDR